MLYTVSLKFRGNTVWDSEAVATDTSSHPSETALAKPLQLPRELMRQTLAARGESGRDHFFIDLDQRSSVKCAHGHG